MAVFLINEIAWSEADVIFFNERLNFSSVQFWEGRWSLDDYLLLGSLETILCNLTTAYTEYNSSAAEAHRSTWNNVLHTYSCKVWSDEYLFSSHAVNVLVDLKKNEILISCFISLMLNMDAYKNNMGCY